MRLQPLDELEKMIKKVLEIEATLPEDYELDIYGDPVSVAKLTMYSMAHRIRELEAELEKYRNQHGDLQAWVDMNLNRNTVRWNFTKMMN